MDPSYLIVDDSLTDAHDARTSLQEAGEATDAIEVACSAREAMYRVRQDHPDVVLLDLTLPDMGGHELARDLQEETPESEIVVLTGLREEDRRVAQAQEQGCGVVEKPLAAEDVQELAEVVRGSQLEE